MRIAIANGHEQRVISAIHRLRDRFEEAVRIEELAAVAKMSPSAFHRQFKALTSMTRFSIKNNCGCSKHGALWFPMPPMSKRLHSKLGMKAHRNSAVNMPECSGFLRDAIYSH
jgi:hypothetical protein